MGVVKHTIIGSSVITIIINSSLSGMPKKSPFQQELPKRVLSDAEINRIILKRYRKRNALMGLALLSGVIGVYAYSMYAVKQEKFLDEEFDKPAGLSSHQETAQGSAAGDKT